ncbi:MAG: c-type cytochrome biogenesis protein CcmI [Nitratireductor sp.]|jgi:cytochrome c-type biogenesis protein CcmH|nr:c-type cytochrome biogenesis protein CcmI [Nitratireductor sp.]
MIFWLFAALLAAGAVASVVWPLVFSRAGKAVPAIAHDREIYHARIREIASDEALGRISPVEAEAARAEEGRKLLAASAAPAAGPAPVSPGLSRFLVVATVIMVPLFSVLAYLVWGQPSMPDMAIASRVNQDPQNQSIEQLISRAEAQLAKNPDDVRGWTVLAPIYMRMGRFDDGVKAWRNAARLEPENLDYKGQLAEALVVGGQGVVTQEARKLFEEMLAARPGDPKSRFYLALELSQQGNLAAAEDSWRKLLADAPPDAPWREAAVSQLNQVLTKAGKPLEQTARAAPGPTQEQVAAASEMSPEERQQMIEGMVAGLAERLKADPSDKDGWLRLIRAYGVMGKDDEALAAIATAKAANSADNAFVTELAGLEASIRDKQGSAQ